MDISLEIDCKGLPCPMPIVKIKKAIKTLEPGQILRAVADDPGFLSDIKAWCEMTGNNLLDVTEDDGVFTALLQRT